MPFGRRGGSHPMNAAFSELDTAFTFSGASGTGDR